MKKLMLLLAIAFTTGLVASTAIGVGTYGLGFIAPQINDKDSVANPITGEIVFDQGDGNFYGRDAGGNWLNLSGSATSAFPIGGITAFAGTSAPAGYLICDGSAVSRSTYASLFAVIGTAFGAGDGSTTFNLPDLRGRFLRGVDGSAGVDPDKTTRTAMASGGNTGNNVGSIQLDAFQGHAHQVSGNGSASNGYNSASSGSAGNLQNTISIISNGTNGTPRVSNETRPQNAYVNYIIKY